jgi:FPC/CPF motif-containing protein YcgG
MLQPRACTHLASRYQIIKDYGPNTWQRQAYGALDAVLSGTRNRTIFSCIYGTKAHEDNSLVYLFLGFENLTDPQNVRAVAEAILTYIPITRTEALVSSMVVLTPNSGTEAYTIELY